VNVTDAWGCQGSDSILITVVSPVSIRENTPCEIPAFVVSGSQVCINWNSGCGKYPATLYDMNGHILDMIRAGDQHYDL
jgi:hypothetical protein